MIIENLPPMSHFLFFELHVLVRELQQCEVPSSAEWYTIMDYGKKTGVHVK